ncbi:flagellar brake protein [Methyloversatilis sp.]|uniref:flagellar brake protein n=1 Tax=Methyloversatilis sp. TaxID=2569862 RepID=UPI003F72496A
MIPVRKSDVALGKPLPYSLFDQHNTLLLKAGVIVQTQNQLDVLSERGLYRDRSGGGMPSVTVHASHPSDSKPEVDNGAVELDLDDIRLRIGDVVQLQGAADDAPRHTVRLLGHMKGRSVMVTAPMVDGSYALVKQDATFVVRFFSGKNVHAFPARVLKSVNTPFPYLHLSYPKKVSGMRIRRTQRAAVRVIAAVTDPAGASHAATLIDLSKGGALLAGRTAFGDLGEPVVCKFRLRFDDIDQLVQLAGLIRSVSEGRDDDGEAAVFNHGIQFAEIPAQDNLALTAYIYHQLIAASEGR